MNHEAIIEQLEANANVPEALVAGMASDQIRWKQTADKWSILEVLCHLYDEDWEDFRPRVQGPLGESSYQAPPLEDPEKRAIERNYNEREIDDVLQSFKEERRKSCAWLRSAESLNWKSGFELPGFKTMLMAENVLAAWLGHDNLHFRQILTIQWNHLSEHIKPLDLKYVGSL